MIKRNDGFTLVEMMVSIIAGTLATAAVATLLLLGMRMNARTSEMATRDNQIMIGLTVMGDIAKENEIEIIPDETLPDISEPDNTLPWSIKDANDNSVIYYRFADGAINVNGVPLIENVDTASVVGPDEDTGLLKIVLTVDNKQYPLAVRCRTGQTITMPTEETEPSTPSESETP